MEASKLRFYAGREWGLRQTEEVDQRSTGRCGPQRGTLPGLQSGKDLGNFNKTLS